MLWRRKLVMCWWGGCGGTIAHDSQGIRWRCQRCSKIAR